MFKGKKQGKVAGAQGKVRARGWEGWAGTMSCGHNRSLHFPLREKLLEV